jgi:3'-phosphoadenosine 5'-phosphosulfate sulfotransferase (PAPS reductase)/FAD synthetase
MTNADLNAELAEIVEQMTDEKLWRIYQQGSELSPGDAQMDGLVAVYRAGMKACTADAKADALDEASAELNRRLVAEMDGPRKNESTTRRISFGQGVQLGKRVLRELAAVERTSITESEIPNV